MLQVRDTLNPTVESIKQVVRYYSEYENVWLGASELFHDFDLCQLTNK